MVIGSYGFIALVIGSEGNTIGLHSMPQVASRLTTKDCLNLVGTLPVRIPASAGMTSFPAPGQDTPVKACAALKLRCGSGVHANQATA